MIRSTAALLLVAPLAALAQQGSVVSRFDVELFAPSAMAECSLVVGCGEAGLAGDFRVGLVAYTSTRPLVLHEEGRVGGGGAGAGDGVGDVIWLRSGVELVLAYAVRDGLEIHGSLPYVVIQGGDDLTRRLIAQPASRGSGSPVAGVRWTAWSEQRGAPLTLALRLDAAPPLGRRDALAGNAGWVLEPRVEVAHWTEAGVVAAEVGANLRGQAVQLGVDRLGSAIAWSATVAGRTQPLRAELSLRGVLSGQGAGVEVLLGTRLRAGPVEVSVLAGRGFGGAAGIPDLRAMGGLAWIGEASARAE